MKRKFIIFTAAVLLGIQSFAQEGVAINATGTSADNSAMLDVSSTTKGFLPPRLTEAQRDAIVNPAPGLILWCTDCGTSGELQVFGGTSWTNLAGSTTPSNTCGTTFVDSRDGKSYGIVRIGNQCWMAQNLNIGTRIDASTHQLDNSTIEKFCIDNIETNCTTYGGLYQWAEAVQYLHGATNSTTWNPEPAVNVKGICPDGWHLPSATEWATLITTLGGSAFAGGKLKETGTTHWITPNTGASNSSGFTGLPGGQSDTYNSTKFLFSGSIGGFWGSTDFSSVLSSVVTIKNTTEEASMFNDEKDFGYSVRCLRDN